MGLQISCQFRNFSTKDAGSFEDLLTEWCTDWCSHGKSMLIFNRYSLRIEKEHVKDVIDNVPVYKVVLDNITFAYTCIAKSSMCIMYKIWENKTLSAMHNMPLTWENAELWLGD